MSRKKLFLIILAPVGLILFYYSLSHIYSNLPVERPTKNDLRNKNFGSSVSTPEEKKADEEWREKNIWRSYAYKNFPFPNHSPDGRFYVNMNYQKPINLWIMEMYRSSDNKLLGTYSSHKIAFLGWRPDSSGVYAQRLGLRLGSGGWNILPTVDMGRPLVVALVPPKPLMRRDVFLLAAILLAAVIRYYLLPYSKTTLTVAGLTEADRQELESIPEQSRWSGEDKDASPFPVHSPDGRHYVTVDYRPFGRIWTMEMYRSADNGKLGSFASRRMVLYGWSSDSSRLYVRPGKKPEGPVKAVLVPPQEYGG